MDLTHDEDAERFRKRVQTLLDEHLPPDWQGVGALAEAGREQFLTTWREVLREGGFLAPAVPAEYGGGGLTVIEEAILCEEFALRGVSGTPHPNDKFGFNLLLPTLLHWGTEEQKAKYVTPTITGEIKWAQGYSEPEAGSDLFSLRTRAVLDGDEWIINGQKTWQTAGPTANWIFALVRTDPDAERSKGISFVVIPIDQPGVEVRGIKNMAGQVEFAEVFFTDARTHASNVIGGVNNGAKVALTLLGFERGAGGIAAAATGRIELERLVELAKAKGMNTDPHVRQRIVRCISTVQVIKCIALKVLTSSAAGAPPGPESSIIKLLISEYRKVVTELAVDILGRDALALEGADVVEPLGAQPRGLDPVSSRAWIKDFLHARPGTVYGGSSEIQRTTIAEQVLGLPREPRISIRAERSTPRLREVSR